MVLKAFIGHSFTADDEQVVYAFLKFFEKIKEMNIGLSWEHAESAEPKELADKVLRLMHDKNLFIGICTKKEAVISPEELIPTRWSKNFLKAKAEAFEPKTSDWIIQEIGLAIGKGMELILLVENGLRHPGGLQGNKEYIVFDRQSPEKAYPKILEMIQSLIPKAKAVTSTEVEVRTSPVEKAETDPKQDKDWLKPKPDWKREDFERALFRSLVLEDKEKQQEIFQAYLATEETKDTQKRESWDAYYEWTLLSLGKGGKLTILDNLADVHPDNSDVLLYRAKGYQKYDEQEKAARYFEVAAEKAKRPLDKMACYGNAAWAFARATRQNEAERVIEQMKSIAQGEKDCELSLLYALRGIAKIEKADKRFCGLTETLLGVLPGDTELRFELAYKYAELGDEELSLYHYLKIPFAEREAGTWNNLGVQFQHFELMASSVDAYQRAEKGGNTLAMSNLAQKFITAGFLKEAEDLCNRATKIDNYHKNVGYAITRIKEVPEAEEKKKDEILEKATPVSEFLRDYGHALMKKALGEHQSRWQGTECELSLTISGESLVLEGSFVRSYPGGGLLSLLYDKAIVPDTAEVTAQYLVRYEGTISGKAVEAKFTKTSQEEKPSPPGLLGGGAEAGKAVLMILSDSLNEIRVYEKSEKENKFQTFKRLYT